jgi:hypothetical protein
MHGAICHESKAMRLLSNTVCSITQPAATVLWKIILSKEAAKQISQKETQRRCGLQRNPSVIPAKVVL